KYSQYGWSDHGQRSQDQRGEQISAKLGRAQRLCRRGVGLRAQCRSQSHRHGGGAGPLGGRGHHHQVYQVPRRIGARMRKTFLAAALIVLAGPAAAQTDINKGLAFGKYQAVLGDCEGCHGKDLSGGIVLETPFGKMVAPNITPDKETGIGTYTGEDFKLAMTRGVAPGGKRLYPAMPYPYYARVNDRSLAAMWGYLKTVKPVKKSVE